MPQAYPLHEMTLWFPKRGLILFADEGMYTIGETNVPPKDEDQEFLSECILRAKEDYPNMIPGPMDPLHWRRLDVK